MNNMNVNASADGARAVEVAPDGSVHELPPTEPPTPMVPPAKPTKLSPHTFGER